LVHELRKLQRTSDGTYFVTIPKSWVIETGLKQGNHVSILKDGKRLIVQPYGEETVRTIRKVVLKPSNTLEREIEENYLLGADVIEIRSNNIIQLDVRKNVKKVIKRFVGLEIVEEESRNIVIQCLLEPSLLTPGKVLRRLHLISLEMGKDAIKALITGNSNLGKVVMERDDEVDRMYFMLVRILRKALSNSVIAEKLSINLVDCLDYRVLASLIEHFADYSTEIAKLSLEREKIFPPELSSLVRRIGDEVSECYQKAFEAVLSKNLDLALRISSHSERVKTHLKELEEKSGFNKSPVHLASLTSTFGSMNEICVDIADLTRTK